MYQFGGTHDMYSVLATTSRHIFDSSYYVNLQQYPVHVFVFNNVVIETYVCRVCLITDN